MSTYITCDQCGATLECAYSQDEGNEKAALFITTDWDGNVVDVYLECPYCGACEIIDEAPRRKKTGPEGDVHVDKALTKVAADYLGKRITDEFVGDKVGLYYAEETTYGRTPGEPVKESKWQRFVKFMTKQRGSGRG